MAREAAEWLRKAAERDRLMAQYAFSVMLVNAEGVPKDLIGAYMWSLLSSRKNYENSSVVIGQSKKQMTPEQLAEALRRVKEWVIKNLEDGNLPTWKRIFPSP